MRLRNYKWLVLVGVLAGGYKAFESQLSIQHWFHRHQFKIDGIDRSVPSQVYALRTNRWLEFSLPKDTPLIRLISNASIAVSDLAAPGTKWPYAIEYQLQGDENQIIDTGVYHFKGEHLAFVDSQSGEPVEVNSYLDRRLTPLGGRRCMLNLTDPAMADARRLRVRLHSSHPELKEVAVRLYYQVKVPERKISYQWSRLSEDQQRDLARGNVYSIDGLTENEKYGLLQYRWSVAAPEGIPGTDFQRRTLYIRDDSERLQLVKPWQPAGIPVDATHRGILPITNAPGTPLIRMEDHTSTSATAVVSTALVWHGEYPGEHTNQLTWSGTKQTLLPVNRDGILEVGSSRAIYLRAYQVTSDATNEITPDPVHVVAFDASTNEPVEYHVDHVEGERTFFRVDLRRRPLTIDDTPTAASSVRCALLSANGVVVQRDTVTLTNTSSAYDWLAGTNGLTNITDPQSLCYVLPPTVQRVRIAPKDETVLVSAYSRPSQLVKTVLVPDDYAPTQRLMPEQPDWFTLHPPDHIERRAAGRYALVRVQARPPANDPLILAGEYEWESFLPSTESRGQMILMPTAEGQVMRQASLPFTYSLIPVGREHQVNLQGDVWDQYVTPSVMLVSTGAIPRDATVTMDGRTVFKNTLAAPVTQIQLGRQTTAEHALKVEVTGQAEAYLNFIWPESDAVFRQRFCIKASSSALHFPYLKRQTGDELLVLRVFSPLEPEPTPFIVHLRLTPESPRAIGPVPELTVLERNARITPNATGRTHLVASHPAQLDQGQKVFLRVGADVPPGRHDLEIRVVADSPRWVAVSRTTPGLAQTLELASKRRRD